MNYSEVTPQRWSKFSRAQQVLQIGLELVHCERHVRLAIVSAIPMAIERTLQLIDLTLAVQVDTDFVSRLGICRSRVSRLLHEDRIDRAQVREIACDVFKLDADATDQITYLDPC